MAENEADHTFRAGDLYGERIRFVIRGSGHRQADDDPGSLLNSRREPDQGAYVSHFATCLRIAVKPNHIPPVGAP